MYARNCDIYYDSKKGMIVFSKRGLNFVLKRTRDDMKIIKEIIKLCYESCDIEKIFDMFPEEKRRKYYAYAKLLWQKKILVEVVREEIKLNPAIVDLLISNYDADERLIQFWTNVKVVFQGCEYIRKTMETYGIESKEYSDIQHYCGEKLFAGNFSKQRCKEMLDNNSKILLYRESEGTSYMLYMVRFDEEKYERFQSFTWKGNSSFYAKKNMIPIRMFMYLSSCMLNAKNPELLCITEDGTLHSFSIGNLYAETSAYFNRDIIPQVTVRRALMEIEGLVHKVPYLVAACNVNNNLLQQSPICNYEVVFGTDFGGKSHLVFHESYEIAAVKAFAEGLELMLNKGAGNDWCCGINKLDYYAKGYISLLEDRNQCYEIVQHREYVAGRIRYLQERLNIKLRVYYRPSPVEEIGGIVLCDEDCFILYDEKYSYEPEKSLLSGIYKIIGEKQILKKTDLIRRRKLQEEYTVMPSMKALAKEKTVEEVIRELQNYYGNLGRIIDEKIWAYQVQIQETGMHVGKFYLV